MTDTQPVNWQAEIDRHYKPGPLRDLLLKHSRSVAELALELAHRNRLALRDEDIVAGAMLHDIGIIRTDADGIGCFGTEPYLRHGIIGAGMLREDGMPEWTARIAERHTGAGLTAGDIRERNLPLPAAGLLPETLLERLICYADKFYSKSGSLERKSMERVEAGMKRFSAGSYSRFEALRDEFGAP